MASAAGETAVPQAATEPGAALAGADLAATSAGNDVVQHISSLKKELEHSQSHSPIDYHSLLATLSRLQSIDQQLITAHVLQQTQIGVLVNKLTRPPATATTTASEAEVAAVRDSAKSIIAQWKDKVKARSTSVTSPLSTTTTIALPALFSSPSLSSSSLSSFPTPSSPAALSAAKAPSAPATKGASVPSSTTASTALKRKPDTTGGAATLQTKKSRPDEPASPVTPATTSAAVAPSPPVAIRTTSTSSSSSLSPPSTPGSTSMGSGGGGSEEKFVLGATRDSVRNKIQQLLFESIGGSAGQWETELAVRIERAIFAQHGGTSAAYKNKYRELAMNLKDKSNPDLNDALICGAYSPEQVVAMSVKELASKQLKEQRQAEAKWAQQEARSDLGKLNGLTDMFRCGKCRERKCTYYQMQTRSADEPMTVFVRCTVCGNRWKM